MASTCACPSLVLSCAGRRRGKDLAADSQGLGRTSRYPKSIGGRVIRPENLAHLATSRNTFWFRPRPRCLPPHAQPGVGLCVDSPLLLLLLLLPPLLHPSSTAPPSTLLKNGDIGDWTPIPSCPERALFCFRLQLHLVWRLCAEGQPFSWLQVSLSRRSLSAGRRAAASRAS